MSFVRGLTCKECGTAYPVTPRMICDECFGPVEVSYDYAAMRGVVTRERIESGPRSLWRYRDLLPIEGEPRAGLRSGFTPLVRARAARARAGRARALPEGRQRQLPDLQLQGPRGGGGRHARDRVRLHTVGCASTGNLAHAVAAHAAAAGLEAVIFIPHDLEAGKVVATLVFGPRLVKIRGNYDDVNRLCTEIADEYGWAIVNVNLRPYYTEGAKTHGFEIAEQLGWRLPKHTVIPVAGGTILPKVWKAYREFVDLGLVADDGPRIHAAQAAGCNPVARAIESGAGHLPAAEAATPSPRASRSAIRRTGRTRSASCASRAASRPPRRDGEILDAIERLARTEGIFTEPAGRHDARVRDQADRVGPDPEGRVGLRLDHGQRAQDDRGAAGPPARGAGDRGEARGFRGDRGSRRRPACAAG